MIPSQLFSCLEELSLCSLGTIPALVSLQPSHLLGKEDCGDSRVCLLPKTGCVLGIAVGR